MDRRSRIVGLSLLLVAVLGALSFQAAVADPLPTGPRDDAYPGDTLITVQSYGWFDNDNGQALVVSPDGEVRWRFDPPDSRVFDAEVVPGGNVMVSVATRIPNADCPERVQDTPIGGDHCLLNRVVEVDRETGRIVWNYSWYDAFVEWHEVHDADRLPSGETAIVDMGNDRAFVVNRDGEITWSWRAANHIGPGTRFWERYVPEESADSYRKVVPEGDWTHLNDIDRLDNGNFQLSIRNFDVVVEVDRRTKRIVDVIGRPGDHAIMNEQHNPFRIEHAGTLLLADSEGNRVVELDAATGEEVWSYGGTDRSLQWPRDADRLPNGNTLIADSRNFRVIEVNRTGAVVWEHSLAAERGIVYDADRLGIPEEPADVPGGRSFGEAPSPGGGVLSYAASWARFVLPYWVGGLELVGIALSLLVSAALAIEVAMVVRERPG